MPTMSLSVSSSTNRVTTSGYTYDNAGNVTADGTYSYTWNAEGRMASTAGVNYTYLTVDILAKLANRNIKCMWTGVVEPQRQYQQQSRDE